MLFAQNEVIGSGIGVPDSADMKINQAWKTTKVFDTEVPTV